MGDLLMVKDHKNKLGEADNNIQVVKMIEEIMNLMLNICAFRTRTSSKYIFH